MKRLHPNIVLRKNVRNQSSRGGVKPTLIVLHSTESTNVPDSATDLAAVAGWFDNPAAQASAHIIVDADGDSARCVTDGEKAWSCAAYNSLSLNIEQIGHASQGSWGEAELAETARWIAKWSKKFGIPILRGKVQGGKVTVPGVVMHSELGQLGGGHTDPGSGYPIGPVLNLAEEIKKEIAQT